MMKTKKKMSIRRYGNGDYIPPRITMRNYGPARVSALLIPLLVFTPPGECSVIYEDITFNGNSYSYFGEGANLPGKDLPELARTEVGYINRFDSSLGTLTRVDLRWKNDLTGILSVEATDSAPNIPHPEYPGWYFNPGFANIDVTAWIDMSFHLLDDPSLETDDFALGAASCSDNAVGELFDKSGTLTFYCTDSAPIVGGGVFSSMFDITDPASFYSTTLPLSYFSGPGQIPIVYNETMSFTFFGTGHSYSASILADVTNVEARITYYYDPVSNKPISEPATFSVPEPATFALMGFGLAGVGYSRRRRLIVSRSD